MPIQVKRSNLKENQETILSVREIVRKGFHVLSYADKVKSVYVVIIHCFLGLADVFGVLVIGVMGSLAISGISSKAPGDRTQVLLTTLGLDGRELSVQVAILGLIGSLILLSKSLVSLFLSRKTMFFLSRRSALISQRLINSLFRQDISKLRERTIQETIFALTRGVQAVTTNILGATLMLIADLFLIIAFSISLFVVDTLVAISSLTLFACVGFSLYFLMHKRAQDLGDQATKLEILGNSRISEVVMCYRELLVRNRRFYYAKQIGSMRFEIAEAGARVSLMSLLSKYIMEITLVVGGLIVGALQFTTQPPMRATAVIAIFLVSSTRIGPAVLRVQTGLMTIKNNIGIARPTINLIEDYLANEIPTTTDNEITEISPSRGNYEGFKPEVILKGVSFTYPSNKGATIEGVDLRIHPGEFFGIAGPSGSGKSTIVDLMLGIHKPSKGFVQISGIDPLDAYIKWPGAVAYVPQSTNLIDGSIKKNICFGYDEDLVPDSLVESILMSVKLDEFLLTSDGVHMQIGEYGNRLSGGQRQRLGLARALLTNPGLLILDEATSSLDAETEKQITDFLLSMRGQMTMVVVAHRLSTIMTADKIAYISDGCLIGVGEFDELKESIPEFNSQALAMGL